MRKLEQHIWFVVAALLVFAVCSCVVYAKAIPKQQGKVLGSFKIPAKPQKQTEYDRLLAKYLANIAKLVDANKRSRKEEHQRQIAEYAKNDVIANNSESVILDKLREVAKQRRGGKLFGLEGGECYEASILIPTSDKSAHIFAIMQKEKLVDDLEVISFINAHTRVLSEGWLPITQDIYQRSAEKSHAWRLAVFALYRLGSHREEYRPKLESMAAENADDTALNTLFFNIDKQTGLPQVVNSSENIALMNKLVKHSNPGIRVACANYAAEIGDLKLAERICAELLSTRFKGLDNVDGPVPPEDRPLAGARGQALDVMFFKIQNERAFKTIYDLSRLPWSQIPLREEDDRPNKTWVCADAYVLARMEIDHAEGLIGLLK